MQTQQQFKLPSFRTDFYPLMIIALPLVLTGTLQSSLGFFENIFLAHLGQRVLAAGALVSWLFFTMISLIFGILTSVNVLISHQYGAKNHAAISQVFRDAILLALIIVPSAFILFWNAADIYLLFGQSPELIELARLYLHALAWGLLPKFIFIVSYELLIGLGHSRTVMTITILSIPFYILFSYVLIFGKFGFPMLGIAGAGWGMTIADWIITTIVFSSLWFSKTYRQYVRSILTLTKPAYLWEMLRIGIPMGAMYCVETCYFFFMTISMGWISVATLAANQIAIQYLGFVICPVFSIAQAITVRMGHLLGAKEVYSAKQAAYAGLIFTLFFMIIIAGLYWFFPHVLIGIDLNVNDPGNFETVGLATAFLFISAFFQILESIRISLFGALRALKDTRFTLITSIICFWFVALPIGYLLSFPLHFGGQGFWWAMVAGAFCSVVLLLKRFDSKMKSQTSIPF